MDQSIKLERPTTEQLKAWQYLHSTQLVNVSKICGLWKTQYPNIANLLHKPVMYEDITIPHWRILPIDGKATDDVFFDRLQKGIFGANIYLRSWAERDYLPTRCKWHDSFGHLPYLYNPDYSRILRLMGHIYALCNGAQRKQLAALYWYTIEFGLIECSDKVKAFGAGIISSPSEINHVSDGEAERLGKIRHHPTLDEIIEDIEFETEDFQKQYFVFINLKDIEQVVLEFLERILSTR